EERVVFTTALSDEELCWLYKNCIACVAPSTIEGFGLPVVEALLCNARVVCSDIPVFREVGASACRYFSLHGDSPAKSLADAVELAIRQPVLETVNHARFSRS